jgi:hypothetical protein
MVVHIRRLITLILVKGTKKSMIAAVSRDGVRCGPAGLELHWSWEVTLGLR